MPEIDLVDIVSEELDFPEEVIAPIRESIRDQNLFHPLTVIPHIDPASPFVDHLFKIVAGKKRLFALRQLGIKSAPCNVIAQSTTIDQQLEISLHENIKRDNLTWYEQVEMRLQLHNLNLKKRGKLVSGHGGARSKGESSWTVADTARELGIATGLLSQDMDLARAVSLDPSLKNVKDKTTALRLIKNRARREENEAFALLPPEFEMNQVFLGGAEEILKQIPSLTFDACITDPPWSTYSDESLIADQKDLLPIFKEIFRVMKNDSFLYLITSSIDFIHYMQELPKLGFTCQDYPLIWHKTRNITHGRRNWQYARDYEPIVLAVKGNPTLTSSTEISSILTYQNLHYTKLIHPNEKPIELLKELIKHCTYEGNSILDCFAGSGVTLEAAKELKRGYIGIEKDQTFYNKIVRRLK